ncbi:hypothetical protein ACX0G7_05835, partial [Flavitalea antarctica]
MMSYWRNILETNPGLETDTTNVFDKGYFNDIPEFAPPPIPAFSNITNLDPISIGGIDTQHKPQAKTWWHAGKWWCAVPPSMGGTWIYRLDGTTWTPILRLATSGSRTDCWVVGNLVHVLMFKGSGANAIATLEYDAATNTYVNWGGRAAPTNVSFPSGVESATLT